MKYFLFLERPQAIIEVEQAKGQASEDRKGLWWSGEDLQFLIFEKLVAKIGRVRFLMQVWSVFITGAYSDSSMKWPKAVKAMQEAVRRLCLFPATPQDAHRFSRYTKVLESIICSSVLNADASPPHASPAAHFGRNCDRT
jgi:hypothetical protein